MKVKMAIAPKDFTSPSIVDVGGFVDELIKMSPLYKGVVHTRHSGASDGHVRLPTIESVGMAGITPSMIGGWLMKTDAENKAEERRYEERKWKKTPEEIEEHIEMVKKTEVADEEAAAFAEGGKTMAMQLSRLFAKTKVIDKAGDSEVVKTLGQSLLKAMKAQGSYVVGSPSQMVIQRTNELSKQTEYKSIGLLGMEELVPISVHMGARDGLVLTFSCNHVSGFEGKDSILEQTLGKASRTLNNQQTGKALLEEIKELFEGSTLEQMKDTLLAKEAAEAEALVKAAAMEREKSYGKVWGSWG